LIGSYVILGFILLFFLYKIIGEETRKRHQEWRKRRSERLRRKRENDKKQQELERQAPSKQKNQEEGPPPELKGLKRLKASREAEKKHTTNKEPNNFRRFWKNFLLLYFVGGLLLWFIIPIFDIGGFTCDNGEHVPHFWLNDGTDDCGDNSDEEGTPPPSPSPLFAFVCVILSMVIDVSLIKRTKTEISSKERKKTPSKSNQRPLTMPQFLGLSGLTIFILILMNGSKFFDDLAQVPFTCDNGGEITIAELTDGHYDCVDLSDEHSYEDIYGVYYVSERAVEYTGYDDGEGETTIYFLLTLCISIPFIALYYLRERGQNQSRFGLTIIILILSIPLLSTDSALHETWECDNGEEISSIYFYNDGYVHCEDGSDELETDRSESGMSPVFDWLVPFMLLLLLGLVCLAWLGLTQFLSNDSYLRKLILVLFAFTAFFMSLVLIS